MQEKGSARSKQNFRPIRDVQEATIDDIVEEQKDLAKAVLTAMLRQSGPQQFSRVVVTLLQAHMLRETDTKDICVDLADAGTIENTWGGGRRKPRDSDLIRLTAG